MHEGAQRMESSPHPVLVVMVRELVGSAAWPSQLWTTVPHHQGLWPLDFRTTFVQATPPPGTPSSHSLLRPHLSSWRSECMSAPGWLTEDSVMTNILSHAFYTGYSCLENPMDSPPGGLQSTGRKESDTTE